jgi:hypothetical protein
MPNEVTITYPLAGSHVQQTVTVSGYRDPANGAVTCRMGGTAPNSTAGVDSNWTATFNMLNAATYDLTANLTGAPESSEPGIVVDPTNNPPPTLTINPPVIPPRLLVKGQKDGANNPHDYPVSGTCTPAGADQTVLCMIVTRKPNKKIDSVDYVAWTKAKADNTWDVTFKVQAPGQKKRFTVYAFLLDGFFRQLTMIGRLSPESP